VSKIFQLQKNLRLFSFGVCLNEYSFHPSGVISSLITKRKTTGLQLALIYFLSDIQSPKFIWTISRVVRKSGNIVRKLKTWSQN